MSSNAKALWRSVLGIRSALSNFLGLLAFTVFFATSALALDQKGSQHFAELKAQYLSLRNTDVEVIRSDEWIALTQKFTNFADQHARSPDAGAALFHASILTEELYKKFGGADRVIKCIQLLSRVARDYPGHALADDALVRRGDLQFFELKDKDQARISYLEVVRAYPKSDQYLVAKDRLTAIKHGTLKANKDSPSEPAKISSGKPLIVIDPGHGGEDFGAPGLGGLLEKDVVLAIALELEKVLTQKLGAVVRLTRRKDVFVPLAERTSLANDFEADLFVSLHANSSPAGKLKGLEVYYLDNTADQASRKLAERENASTRFEGAQGDLQYMLSDLIQNAKLDSSIILARLVEQELLDYLHPRWDGVTRLGVKKGPFYVLVGSHMPSILVELFFIDNALDGERLGQKQFRSDLVAGLYRGIKTFIEREGKRAN